MNLTGSCSCGRVKYATSAEPVLQGNCHCRECQRMTGSAFSATMFFPEGALTITGEVAHYKRLGASGNEVDRSFCPNCGSPLFGRPGSLPGLVGVRAGTLDDPSLYRPSVNIFTSRAAHWDFMDPALPKFPELPPRP